MNTEQNRKLNETIGNGLVVFGIAMLTLSLMLLFVGICPKDQHRGRGLLVEDSSRRYPSSILSRSAEDVSRLLAHIAPNRDMALAIILAQVEQYCTNPDRYMNMTIVGWLQMPPPDAGLVYTHISGAHVFCKDGGTNNDMIEALKNKRYIMYAGYPGTAMPGGAIPYNSWEMDIVIALHPYGNPDTLELSRNILRPR